MHQQSLSESLARAVACRAALLDPPHVNAVRLFNGFTEGGPDMTIDVYGDTLLLQNHADPLPANDAAVETAQDIVRALLPWLRTGVLKTRNADTMEDRRGKVVFGGPPADRIMEHGLWYAVDLTLNQDASFYLDTRNVRRWALDHLAGKTVLNAFAYTGSFGVAAFGAGAARVVQLDRNGRFLRLAKRSYGLNGFPIDNRDLIEADFFRRAGAFRRSRQGFDCVFLDPPFFATSGTGRIDQMHESARLINKVRPLVNDGGHLVAVNNALFVSGAEYMQTLESLCGDGYLRVEELVPVPEDVRGYGDKKGASGLPDPSPFNHSTKIAVLGVRRKSDKA